MPYDEGLAERIRELLEERKGITEKKMFGGIAFLSNGHMFVGLAGEKFMCRVGPDEYERALKKKHVREMDFTGKPMKGYVFVAPKGYESDADLEKWVTLCLKFVGTLPPKKKK